MKEQEIKETLSDIRNMMERSQKVVFLDGTAGILAGIWAIIGAVAVCLLIYGTVAPLWMASVQPVADAGARTFIIVSVICVAVFCAAFLSVWNMSRRRAIKQGMEFVLDAGSRNLLKTFFSVMVVGGLVCLTPIANGLWALIPGFMLLFYGLALVTISPIAFRLPITSQLGYIMIAIGIAALCLPVHGLCFWTLGFGVIHLFWGIWFSLRYNNKGRK